MRTFLYGLPGIFLLQFLLQVHLVHCVSSNGILNTSQNSWTLLFQNNFNITDDSNHKGALLTSSISKQDGRQACVNAGEKPLSWATISANEADFVSIFNYLCYSGRLSCPATLRIDDGTILARENATSIDAPQPDTGSQQLPQLCSESSTGNMGYNSFVTAWNQIAVTSGGNGNTYIGYRNQKSFRFLGIRYAAAPARFTHTSVDKPTGKVTNNTFNGPTCLQGSGDNQAEDCFFLNIQTPYLPRKDLSTGGLKPVLFYIHGGALISGSANDWTTDGGPLASREDLVVVNINYRLGTYGFLAVPETTYSGNYGLGDVVSALQWVRDNVAYFGGDKSKITIVGQSAGAALVRAIMASPKAKGMFQNAIAMSNLGGGVDLGEASDYGTANTFYLTAAKSYAAVSSAILKATKCEAGSDSKMSNSMQVACLAKTTVPLNQLSTQAQYLVVDNTFINTPYLEVGNPGSLPKIPFISGIMENDGGSFISYSKTCTAEVDCLASNLAISKSEAQSIIDSGLFPSPGTGNLVADAFNVSQRVRTDDTFRCVDQATAYAAATTKSLGPVYYYQNNRADGGYNPNNVPDGSANNDPGTPYYRLHSGDMEYAFGNLKEIHGAPDLRAMKVLSNYWASFVRSGTPNVDLDYLQLRGYMDTYRAVTAMGDWKPVAGSAGPVLLLDDPPTLRNSFVDVEQCRWLNYSLDYFVVHPSGRR